MKQTSRAPPSHDHRNVVEFELRQQPALMLTL